MTKHVMMCSAYPCKARAVWVMSWRLLRNGETKSRPVCHDHKKEGNTPDNWGVYPTFEPIAQKHFAPGVVDGRECACDGTNQCDAHKYNLPFKN